MFRQHYVTICQMGTLKGTKECVLGSCFFFYVQVYGSELIRVKSVFKNPIKISLLLFPVPLRFLHSSEHSKQSKAWSQKNGEIWVQSGTGEQMDGLWSESYFRKLDLERRDGFCGPAMGKWSVGQGIVDISPYTLYIERQGYLWRPVGSSLKPKAVCVDSLSNQWSE